MTDWLPAFDQTAMLLGFGIGLPISLLYFAGLAFSLRRAINHPHPARFLLLSYFVRAGILLGIWLGLTRLLHPGWVTAGYLSAFFIARIIAVRRSRKGTLAHPPEPSRSN